MLSANSLLGATQSPYHNKMNTTYPTGLRCQSWATWRNYIIAERRRTTAKVAQGQLEDVFINPTHTEK